MIIKTTYKRFSAHNKITTKELQAKLCHLKQIQLISVIVCVVIRQRARTLYSNTAQCSICQVSGHVVLATLLGDAVAMVMLDADGQRKSSACRLTGSPYLVRNSVAMSPLPPMVQ